MFLQYVYKKENPLLAKNYRPVSVLLTVTTIFERLMQSQLNEHINQFLSPFLCGYRTGFSSQTALLSLIERWKIMLNNKGYAGAVLMDFSKAFNTINYELLTAKLHIYGFSKDALKLILSYLRSQSTFRSLLLHVFKIHFLTNLKLNRFNFFIN